MKGANPTVYLAGPITGMSYGGAVDWRDKAKKEFAEVGIVAFSPMRKKEYLSKEQAIDGSPKAYAQQVLSRPKGIVTRDRDDTSTVDLVLMNLLPAEEMLLGKKRELRKALEGMVDDPFAGPAEYADVITRNFDKGAASLGTMIELGWADAFRTPVIIVMSEDNPHQHPMVVELAGYVVPTLEEGIELAKTVLLP